MKAPFDFAALDFAWGFAILRYLEEVTTWE
jgi:hypothetical protein